MKNEHVFSSDISRRLQMSIQQSKWQTDLSQSLQETSFYRIDSVFIPFNAILFLSKHLLSLFTSLSVSISSYRTHPDLSTPIWLDDRTSGCIKLDIRVFQSVSNFCVVAVDDSWISLIRLSLIMFGKRGCEIGWYVWPLQSQGTGFNLNFLFLSYKRLPQSFYDQFRNGALSTICWSLFMKKVLRVSVKCGLDKSNFTHFYIVQNSFDNTTSNTDEALLFSQVSLCWICFSGTSFCCWSCWNWWYDCPAFFWTSWN